MVTLICRTATEGSVIYWPDHKPDKQIIKLASQTYSLSGPGFIPRAVPQDIAQELIHGEPIVWWVSVLCNDKRAELSRI